MQKERKTVMIPFYWNENKADWYLKAIRDSDYSRRVIEIITPLLNPCYSVLDVGAGCGALSIPIAKMVKKVTALEPSIPMMRRLKQECIAEGLKNMEFVQDTWEEARLEGHDLILCANVPALLLNPESLVKKAEVLANKYIILIQGVGRENNKFFFKELFPLIFGKEMPAKDDYLFTYSFLHQMGIYSNVRIIEYSMDQEFNDMEEAYSFWKEYLHLSGDDYKHLLTEFLKPKLKPTSAHKLRLPVNKKSAIIWWMTEHD